MLTMEQVYHIRFEHNEKGKSIRKIVKETGFNFRTVKKYSETEDFNIGRKVTQSRKGKLSPYKELIDKWLANDLKAKSKQRTYSQKSLRQVKKDLQR